MFNGILDQVSIWDRKINYSEIQDYMTSQPTGNEAGLVGYWNFNEGSGSTANDLSGNGNNGTISGATWSTDAPAQYANNCTATDDIVVTVNPLPTIDLGADTTLICAGTSEILDAGTGFTSYLWSDGSTAQTLTVNTAGKYTVAGTDANGCTASDSMVIDVLTVDITQNDTTICEGDSLVLKGNSYNQSQNGQLSATLNNGLIGYWPFNGNSNDVSGNNNHGIINNGVALSTNRNNFNNSSYLNDGQPLSYINCGNDPAFDIKSGSFSISSWINLSNRNSSDVIMSKASVNNQNIYSSYDLRLEYGTPTFITTNDNANPTWYTICKSTEILDENKWYHIALFL